MKKVVLIAGASSSFGSLLASKLSPKYLVYGGFNSTKLAKDFPGTPIKLDLTNDRSCQLAIKKIIQTHKHIFAVINLVGISPSGPGVKFSSQDFESILNINVVGAFRLAKNVRPYLPSKGRVINIGSLCSVVSFPNFSLYCASKFALRALSLSLFHEWAPEKRYVTCVSPGAIADNKPSRSFQRSARQSIPLLRLIFPLITQEDVVASIYKVLQADLPRSEVLIGRDTTLLKTINNLLPAFLWNKLQHFVWRKQQK